VVKKSRSKKKLKTKTKKSKAKKAAESDGIEEISGEEVNIEDCHILLYGKPGIGKTTFASKLKNALFFDTQRGTKFLKVSRVTVSNWNNFRDWVKKLEKSKKLRDKYDIFVVDVIDDLSLMCLDFVCNKRKIDHPSDEEWGKGWEALSREWHEWIMRLAIMKGVMFVGHSKEREVTLRGIKVDKVFPNLGATAYRTINQIVDFTFFAGYGKLKKGKKSKEERVLYTRPADLIECKDRTGALPRKMKFDFDTFAEVFYG